ncbi:MAG TPA: LON peptidase substrate-binding domain-containing protein, partial [Anaerovoracaceae bacterium]|nr:LON peptidase substrate-binding domain-containing protein [Anaerovoracaceae bacterium]
MMLNENTKIKQMPLLPLRGLTIFPYMVLHFDVGRQKSISALENAMVRDQEIFLVTQKEPETEDPTEESLYRVGTVSKIKQLLKLPGDTIRVLVEGIDRGEVAQFIPNDKFFEVQLEKQEEHGDVDILEGEALMRTVMDAFEDYIKLSNKISPDTLVSVNTVEDIGQFADIVAANVLVKNDQRQEVLEAFEPVKRLEILYKFLEEEIQILRIERKINLRVKKQIDKVQREYYLREQMKAIQTELGESDSVSMEVEEYRERIEDSSLPEEAHEKATKELERFSRTPLSSPESAIIRTYLDWILDLPWN